MPINYSFFFSYTSADHENAKREHLKAGVHQNLLDEFFNQLTRAVSRKLGRPQEQAAFRDSQRIGLGAIWPEQLTSSLNESNCLLAIITPDFIKSEDCGREVKFFIDRHDMLEPNQASLRPYPIIPIYWENSTHCHRDMPHEINDLLKKIQYKNPCFPGSYPATGLCQIMATCDPAVLSAICDTLAEYVVEMFNNHALPQHSNPASFRDLPSQFRVTVPSACCSETTVSSGVDTVQIVFAVGAKGELEAAGLSGISTYDDTAEDWQPFNDAPGATIESATLEGIKREKLKCCKWGWPENIVDKIAEAETKKSPVLLVLDSSSLIIERIKSVMTLYDKRNFNNSALITAGGTATDEEMKQVLCYKFSTNHPLHLWTVPAGRNDFVDNVAQVVGNLKRKLLSMHSPGLQPSTVPGIGGPCGN